MRKFPFLLKRVVRSDRFFNPIRKTKFNRLPTVLCLRQNLPTIYQLILIPWKEYTMTQAKSLMLGGLLALFSAGAFAAPVPAEIYKPAGAQTVKADRQGNGEFEYEAELSSKGVSIPSLAKQVIAHAKSKGFKVVESEIKRDDADLKFKRGQHELDVSIEDKDNGRIEYKADLDLDKN